MGKLKVCHLCAGVGAPEMALKRLGIDFDNVGYSEIDKFAIKSYTAIHGEQPALGNLEEIQKLPECNLLFYGTPCLTGDTLVFTKNKGYIPITEVTEQDEVIGHDGKYHKVLALLEQGEKSTYKVIGMGNDEIRCTPNHQFYVRRMSRVWDNAKRTYCRQFSQPEWKACKDLEPTYDYLGVPVNTINEIPDWEGVYFHPKKAQDHAFFEDGFIWYPVRKVIPTGNIETVYDLMVEDAHSFVANNCIVHNCQNFSIAGDKAGVIDDKGQKTRSGLLLDVERLLITAKEENKLPEILVMENVKNLVGSQFKPYFESWLQRLEEFGYNNYWQVLNSKNYGVPQSRDRVFVVSIRQDIDKKGYVFPEPIELKTRVKDILETNVPEHYYLSQHTIEKIAKSKFHSERDRIIKGDICQTLRARDFKDPVCVKEPKVNQIANYLEGEGNYWKNPNNGRIYSKEGLAPTINTMEGGNRQPKIVEGDESFENEFRVRKLTERECWRLMGFSEEDINKVKAVGISRSQMYKQAGNSIVVDVLYYIFKNLPLDSIINL